MNLLNKLQEPWGFYRILRVALGAYFGYQSYVEANWLFSAFAALLLFQALLNLKCLPCELTGTCDVPSSKKQDHSEEIQFEEVK